MNYYISDLHFNCYNKFEGRTLLDDKILIRNWNRTVHQNDTVYILGDIGRIGGNKDNEYLCQCLAVLKGKKVLIVGNHDTLKDSRIAQQFTEICDYKEISDNTQGRSYYVVMSHYPMLFWNRQNKGAVHLYGHVHNSEEFSIYQECLEKVNGYFQEKTASGATDCPPAKAYNVGCMLSYMNYCPRTLSEIMEGGERTKNIEKIRVAVSPLKKESPDIKENELPIIIRHELPPYVKPLDP